MYPTIESLRQFGRSLERERKKRGLSQRALGENSGATQSQVSRIENGEVDPRLSTAIELTRALEMDLILVPRRRLSAVEAVIGREEKEAKPIRMGRDWNRRLRTVRRKLAVEPERQDYARIYSLLRSTSRLDHAATSRGDELELSAVDRLLSDLDSPQSIGRLTEFLEEWRNRIAHKALSQPSAPAARPAYSLDHDQDV